MNGDVTKHPIDFEALEKGTWLEQHEIEEAVGVSPQRGAKWAFAVLRLCEQIRENAGILCCQRGERIRLMSDAEASEYNFRMLAKSVRREVRCAEDLALIDAGEFDDRQRRIHEARSQAIMAVAEASRRELKQQRKLLAAIKASRPALEAVND